MASQPIHTNDLLILFYLVNLLYVAQKLACLVPTHDVVISIVEENLVEILIAADSTDWCV